MDVKPIVEEFVTIHTSMCNEVDHTNLLTFHVILNI